MTAPALIAEPLARIRPDELDWEPLGTHGLRRKRLGYDEASGHVTALVEIPVGWHGGGIAHYHHAFEEVFMLAGSVTVGGKHYWHADDYFFRPAEIVHGHDERAEEGATALIRSDGPLELLLVHEPEQPDEYPLPAYDDGRGHLYSLPTAQVAWIADPEFPEGWRIQPLSADARSGARTVMVEIPAGWVASGSARPAAWEACVLEGGLEGEKADFAVGDYSAGPAGTEVFGARSSTGGCRFILWLFAPEHG
jgi:quercetin dioxygenase-like cupin family protein